MPELPEVQTTVSGLQKYIIDCTITEVVFYRDSLRYPLDSQWIERIRGQHINTISRRAKLIVMNLDDDFLQWHLGMTGSLRVCQKNDEMRKHDHIEMHLSNESVLRYHDPRRFGHLKLFSNEAELNQSIEHYGLEPLSDDFDAKYLYQRSRNKKQTVKQFIMDQAVVVGVGNIYACEALFLSAIRPQTAAGTISLKRYEQLVLAIKSVLDKAIAQGGTTLKDFENADAQPGYFQQSLFVYGREGEICERCQTLILAKRIGGRNSFYCKKCQRS